MLLGRLLKGTVLQRSEIEELVYSYHPWRKDFGSITSQRYG
jgi:hypothetical protein